MISRVSSKHLIILLYFTSLKISICPIFLVGMYALGSQLNYETQCSFDSVHIAKPAIIYIPKIQCWFNDILCTQNTLNTYYDTVARFSSQKSIRTFHFQKVPFAVGFFKNHFVVKNYILVSLMC